MTDFAPVIGPGNGVIAHGQMYLTESSDYEFASADTYEKITGAWAGRLLHFFEYSESGILTYKGASGTAVLLNGSSDLSVDRVSALSYGLFKNGVLIPDAETPKTIAVPNRLSNISITYLLELDRDDDVEIYAKCDDATATLTAQTLSITCWGDHR